MELNNCTKIVSFKAKRVGRGRSSGMGKTSCRGFKGQKSRAGYSSRFFEGGQMNFIKSLPKRGFSSLNKRKVKYNIVNIEKLYLLHNKMQLSDKDTITKNMMFEFGLIRNLSSKVKVLGKGKKNDRKIFFESDKQSKTTSML